MSAMIVSLEISCFTFVFFVFAIAGKQLQVFKSVVCNVMVDMMHNFGTLQRTTKRLSNNQTMLHHISVFSCHTDEFRRATHILDARWILTLALAISNPALPGRIVRTAHLLVVRAFRFFCPGSAGFMGMFLPFFPPKNSVAPIRTNRGINSLKVGWRTMKRLTTNGTSSVIWFFQMIFRDVAELSKICRASLRATRRIGSNFRRLTLEGFAAVCTDKSGTFFSWSCHSNRIVSRYGGLCK